MSGRLIWLFLRAGGRGPSPFSGDTGKKAGGRWRVCCSSARRNGCQERGICHQGGETGFRPQGPECLASLALLASSPFASTQASEAHFALKGCRDTSPAFLGGFPGGRCRAPRSYQESSSTRISESLPDSANPWMSKKHTSSKMGSNWKISHLTHIYYLPICPRTSENSCVFTTCLAYKVSSHLISVDALNNEAGKVTPTLWRRNLRLGKV